MCEPRVFCPRPLCVADCVLRCCEQGAKQGVACIDLHGQTPPFCRGLMIARGPQSKGSAIGHGAKQAPVAQPAMLLHPEEVRAKNPKWLSLYATRLQSMGCVRLTHVQQRRLVSMDGCTVYWECVCGKQCFFRVGFLWSTRRFGIAEDTDLSAIPRNTHPRSIAFDLATGVEVSPATTRRVVQLAMANLMYTGEVQKVSSKSWRELPVTLGFLAGLNATDVCALGNWLNSASQGCDVMPWRYHRAKPPHPFYPEGHRLGPGRAHAGGSGPGHFAVHGALHEQADRGPCA